MTVIDRCRLTLHPHPKICPLIAGLISCGGHRAAHTAARCPSVMTRPIKEEPQNRVPAAQTPFLSALSPLAGRAWIGSTNKAVVLMLMLTSCAAAAYMPPTPQRKPLEPLPVTTKDVDTTAFSCLEFSTDDFIQAQGARAYL